MRPDDPTTKRVDETGAMVSASPSYAGRPPDAGHAVSARPSA